MPPTFVMIDDFVANPSELRRQALGLGYDPAFKKGNYPGLTSERTLQIPGLDDHVSKVIGAPVTGAPGTLHGHCRLTLKGDRGRSGVHIDPTYYSGILYLSRPEDCRGGTEFYRHKRTGTDRMPSTLQGLRDMGYESYKELEADILHKDGLDRSKWELTMEVPMRFNRLVLLNPYYWHTAGPGFGDNVENGRLIHVIFYQRMPAGGGPRPA